MRKLFLALTLFTFGISFAAQAAESVDGYVVNENGVGPLDATTPLEPVAIEKRLPEGFSVRWESVQFGNAAPYPVLRVWDGGKVLMELESYTPHNPQLTGITVLTPRIADERGARVGARMKSLYRYGDKPDCMPGVGRFSGAAICHAPSSAHVFYIFRGKKPAPENVVPAWDELAKSKLVAIMWSAS